jgi:hypothetical protein
LHRARSTARAREGFERHHRRVQIDDGDRQAVSEVAAPGRQGMRDISEGPLGARAQRGCQPARLLAHGFFSLAREAQQRVGAFGRGPFDRRRRGGLFEDHMGIGAAEPKGAHARASLMAILRPGLSLSRHPHRNVRPRNVRTEAFHVQVRRNALVPQRERGLHHAGDAGRCLEVPEVGLDGPNPQGVVGRSALPVHRGQGLDFNRVTERRPGPMRFDVVHLGGCDSRVGQCIPEHTLL